MEPIAIYGAGGHGTVVAEAASLTYGHEAIELFDENEQMGPKLGPWRIAGNFRTLLDRPSSSMKVVIAVGRNKVRKDRSLQILNRGFHLLSVVHPTSSVSTLSDVGQGSAILAGAIVSPFARLGMGVIINTAASVDHDCKIGDYCHLSPGVHVGGGVWIGEMSWIGIGASVKQGIKIGRNVLIGAGATVIKDIPDNVVAFGVPARVIRENIC